MPVKKLCVFSAASFLTIASVTAFANWTEFYAGLNGGYGWGSPSVLDTELLNGNPAPYRDATPNTLYPSIMGGTFGGQFGFDWQLGQWFVLGLKYDMDWSGITGSETVAPFLSNEGNLQGSLSTSESITWFGNLLPRFGFLPIPNLLIYGTGGLAFANFEGSFNHNDKPGPGSPFDYSASATTVLPGWSAGAGAEWMFITHWSLSAEYLYNGLENETLVGNPVPATTSEQKQFTFKTNYQTTELAINYRF